MDKEALLLLLTGYSEALMPILEGVPHEALELPQAVDTWSVKNVCAYFTTWDGEALRRIDFFSGQRFEPPHNLHDEAYWLAWVEKQLAIKGVMSVQGTLVDMIGTRQRLLTRLSDLSDFHLVRWLVEDPQATQPYFPPLIAKLKQWRATWDEANPPSIGLKKWWQNWRKQA